MKHNKIQNLSFRNLLEEFFKYLESKSYAKSTLANYRRTLIKIERYMSVQGITDYSMNIGLLYYQYYLKNNQIGVARQNAIHTAIRRLNDFYLGLDYTLQEISEVKLLPNKYEQILEQFTIQCYKKGNKEITVKAKQKFVRSFLKNCIFLGCTDLCSLNTSYVVNACLRVKNKDGWAVISVFLRFLTTIGIHEFDFSTLVPHYKRPINVPVTYSEEEIIRFENTIDRTSDIGKRDYALVLLATRIGMRSGDIVKLGFDEVNFTNNTISYVQQKTGAFQQLPMLPEIRDALADYINNARPKEISNFIFLRHYAPFQKISTSVLRFRITQYFKKAGIDIEGKKHGPHAFRSSLASSMVNADVPYEAVRVILGHNDPNAIKHYAKLDIEKLRECAIEVPNPTYSFKTFLEGGVQK